MADQFKKSVQSKSGSASSLLNFRLCVQLLFLIITLFVGIQFYLFVEQLESGAVPTIERPPGVEAFLPISALVSLKYLLFTGIINNIHPAALILFLIIVSTALMFKKGFCSWICPFGLLSDYLTKLNLLLFKKQPNLPKWVDLPLRGIKYIIAGFFLWSIFFKMPVDALGQFIQSPYNTFADIKMLELFTKISNRSLWVITILLIFSVIIKNFWCRYLCPYGALLGVFSFFSMGKIRRNDHYCTNCGACENVCPGIIPIRKKMKINSLECSACLRCVDVCPQKNAIGFSLFSGKVPMNKKRIALVLIVFFISGITAAKLTGHWQNDVPVQAYQQHILRSQMPQMPRGNNAAGMKMEPEKMKKMIEMMQKMQERKSNQNKGLTHENQNG